MRWGERLGEEVSDEVVLVGGQGGGVGAAELAEPAEEGEDDGGVVEVEVSGPLDGDLAEG